MEYYNAYHATYRTYRTYRNSLQSPASNQYRATLRTTHLQDTLNIILSKTSIIFCRNYLIIQLVFISFAELLIIKINTHEQSRTYMEIVTEKMSQNEEIALIGFGTLIPRPQSSRMARNPKTGTPVRIKARTTVKFKPGKFLLEAINGKK